MTKFTIQNDIAVIELDNGKANAVGFNEAEILEGYLDEAAAKAKATILTGQPGMLCAGFDLNVIKSGPEAMRSMIEAGGQMLLKFLSHPQPVVVASSGHAVALGALFLLSSDVRLSAAGDYKIGLNETKIGVPLPFYAHELTRMRIMKPKQLEVAVQAKIYSPETAVEVGFIDEIVDASLLMERALDIATDLAKYPQGAFGTAKRNLLDSSIEAIRRSLKSRN